MKTLFIALLLTSTAGLSAHAESFTGTATSTVTNSNVFASPSGKPIVSINLAFTSQTTWAPGKTTAGKGTCTNWSTPPGSIFETNGICNYTDANGDTASILVGCNNTGKDMTAGDCWGGLLGMAGPHANKSGTITWHFKTAPDGKTGTSQSVGQWND